MRVRSGSIGAAAGVFGVLLAGWAGVPSARAQCGAQWVPVATTNLQDGLRALELWDPDGAGPAQPLLAVGASAFSLGPVTTGPFALLNPTTAQWSGVTEFTSGFIEEFLVLSDGSLLAGGNPLGAAGIGNVFRYDGLVRAYASAPTTAGFALAELLDGSVVAGFVNISRWNGATWDVIGNLGSGSRRARAMLTLPDGALLVGGAFTEVNGQPISRVARWQNGVWSQVGTGLSSGEVWALAQFPSGWIVAGGSGLPVAGGGLALWDGSTWSALPGGEGITLALSFHFLPNGDLAIGHGGGVARWDGITVQAFPTPIDGTVVDLEVMPDGSLFAAGAFTSPVPYLARYIPGGLHSVVMQPQSQGIERGGILTLTAAPTPGFTGLTVQWRRNGVPLVDGAGGASPGGGVVFGAVRTLASPSDGSLSVLQIGGMTAGDAGVYTAAFSSPCGTVVSETATITVEPCASVDFNGDGVFPDDADLAQYLIVLGGGPCQ